MDVVDGKTAAKKQGPAKPRATEPARSSSAPNAEAAENMDGSPDSDTDKRDKVETEMKGKRPHHHHIQYCQ